MKLSKLLGATILVACSAGGASASLVEFQSFFGNFAISSDGWGGTDGNGVISAQVDGGSTVAAAYLYSSNIAGNATAPTQVTLDGQLVTGYTNLGTNNQNLTAFRSDVTSIVKSTIESGGGGIYDFAITEGGERLSIDGHALVVVYENAALPEASVGILDGFSDTGGDSTSINFAQGLDVSDPGFFAEMRLGIGFSCCNQASDVSVNGNLITRNAGNNDDGEEVSNGSLITVGGFDDGFSSLLPSYADDTERYNLAASGFLNNGDTSILINTRNPSNDDNIFLAMFYVSGEAGFNEPPPSSPVPLPASAWLMLSVLAGLFGFGRFKTKST
ncbi:PEP-CTERM sorting domain-containing protein [Kordiimonas sp.]|uniref:PEP-CTERM sorting domain-containing protein n=1 Tax=Kordiimonas sp. TaxID=1970157 RepID=UPI003A944117